MRAPTRGVLSWVGWTEGRRAATRRGYEMVGNERGRSLVYVSRERRTGREGEWDVMGRPREGAATRHEACGSQARGKPRAARGVVLW